MPLPNPQSTPSSTPKDSKNYLHVHRTDGRSLEAPIQSYRGISLSVQMTLKKQGKMADVQEPGIDRQGYMTFVLDADVSPAFLHWAQNQAGKGPGTQCHRRIRIDRFKRENQLCLYDDLVKCDPILSRRQQGDERRPDGFGRRHRFQSADPLQGAEITTKKYGSAGFCAMEVGSEPSKSLNLAQGEFVPDGEFDLRSHKRMLHWAVKATGGFESAWVLLGKGLAFKAGGRVFGRFPKTYWADYLLKVDGHGVTRRLDITTYAGGNRRHLEMSHGKEGWRIQGKREPKFAEALDCDIAYSPLTNTMPILRHQLHRLPGTSHLLMVFVEMPGLRVVPSRQTYTHLSGPGKTGLVRFSSGDFLADLSVDARGFVIKYPKMAERVEEI